MKRIAIVTIVLCTILLFKSNADAQVSVGISVSPPAIPVYVQPDCPVDGYIWSPGYWAYDPDDGYYWVPGVWVAPPTVGFLWTPGYWGFYGGYYHWHHGYWGPHCGYYGGINYGFGYWGHGYEGGRWEGGHFRYNTAVTRVNTRIVHNTYVDRSAVRTGGSRAAFNGPGGVSARPSAQDRIAARDKHMGATSVQRSHIQAARKDPGTHFKTNNGNPGVRAAMARPMSSAASGRSASHTNPARTTTHQNTPRAQQNRSATPSQHTNRVPQNHVTHQNTSRPQQQAPRMQSQHQAPQAPQHQSAPRMQAPQQHQAPQQRPQPGGGGGGMGRMPQQSRPAPQRAPMPMGGGHEGGGEGRRR